MKFKLATSAKNDVLEITDYYTNVSATLAESFVTELETTLRALCLQPGLGSRRYAHFTAKSFATLLAARSLPVPIVLPHRRRLA